LRGAGAAARRASPLSQLPARLSTTASTPAPQARALELALKEINSRFGKNSVMTLGGRGDFGEVQCSPSGALTLDLALGGGYPRGRVVEIYGPESSGKTTLALHAMAEVQKGGGTVALIDAEHAFDPVFAKRCGVDVDALLLCQPDSGEMGLEVADQLIRSSAVELVAVDSVAALVPRSEIEGEIGQSQIGGQARLMSSALRKIAGNASRHGCTIIFLNQLRQKVRGCGGWAFVALVDSVCIGFQFIYINSPFEHSSQFPHPSSNHHSPTHRPTHRSASSTATPRSPRAGWRSSTTPRSASRSASRRSSPARAGRSGSASRPSA
jgi:RecA/RadA recombinase